MFIQMNMTARSAFLTAAISLCVASGASAQDQADGQSMFSSPDFTRSNLEEIWDLEMPEIERYEKLAVEERVYSDPGSKQSPYAVLGKHARTHEERLKYAELENAKMQEHIVKALLWFGASQEASGYKDDGGIVAEARTALDIYDSNPEFQETLAAGQVGRQHFTGPLNRAYGFGSSETQTNDAQQAQRVLFYARISKCGPDTSCIKDLQKLLSKQLSGRVSVVDVIMLEEGGKPVSVKEVTAWINDTGIANKTTINKTITVNPINADSKKLLGKNVPPVAISLQTRGVFK